MSKRSYKLHYFDARGRAEVARLIFAQTETEYEDCRYSREKWVEIKSDMPMNQLPVLEVDGVRIGQSTAINRFLAREYKLIPEDTLEEFYVDMFCGCLDDLGQKYPFFEKDEEKKAKLVEEYVKETAPDTFEKIEKTFEIYKCLQGDFFGKKLSLADLYLVYFGDFLVPRNEHVFKKAPKLAALYKKLTALPKIAAWIEKRPKTEF